MHKWMNVHDEHTWVDGKCLLLSFCDCVARVLQNRTGHRPCQKSLQTSPQRYHRGTLKSERPSIGTATIQCKTKLNTNAKSIGCLVNWPGGRGVGEQTRAICIRLDTPPPQVLKLFISTKYFFPQQLFWAHHIGLTSLCWPNLEFFLRIFPLHPRILPSCQDIHFPWPERSSLLYNFLVFPQWAVQKGEAKWWENRLTKESKPLTSPTCPLFEAFQPMSVVRFSFLWIW